MAIAEEISSPLMSASDARVDASRRNLPAERDAGGGARPAEDARAYPTVVEVLNQPLVRKSLPAILLTVLLSILVIVFFVINGGDYRVLHPGMSEVDRAEAMEVLASSAIPVRLDASTGALTVPIENYHDARMALAAAGLPRDVSSGAMDYLTEQSTMTTSQFMEEALYTAAIENELSRSIARISTVQSARVHIAAPRQSNFIRNKTPTKASVVVTPYSGRSVSQPQVEAIINLVASSVPYLATTDVSVVDDRGNLLTSPSGASTLQQASQELTYQQSVETMYKERIDALLMPLVGEGAVTTKVDVAIDFTEVESTFEEFDQNGAGPRSRSESIRMDMSTADTAQGIPGGVSNIVPNDTVVAPLDAAADATIDGAGAAPNAVRSSETIRNYELDRSVRYTRNQVGTLNRLSVAIAVDEVALTQALDLPDGDAEAAAVDVDALLAEEVAKLDSLVRAAIGFDAARGDALTIVTSRFRNDEAISISLPWHEQPTLIALIKYSMIVLLLALFMVIVVRPVMKIYMPQPTLADALSQEDTLNSNDLSPQELAMLSSGDAAGIDEIKAKLRPKKSSISADMLDTANTYDDKVALIRLLVAEDSARVANVLKKLIKPA
jgi:flagellar M-ring protein FliF